MDINSRACGYSAQVKLWLECGDKIVPLAQVAQDWVMPAKPFKLPPMEGYLVVEIDGDQSRDNIFLREGINPDSNRVTIEHISAVAV